MIKTCPICNKKFNVRPSHAARRRCCSVGCVSKLKSSMYKGSGNPNHGNTGSKCYMWKGGKHVSNYGYMLIHMPDHPMARPDGYIFEHRLVMSDHLGRCLEKSELVHHKDGNKLNNDISNLELTNLPDHSTLHAKMRIMIRDGKGRFVKMVR